MLSNDEEYQMNVMKNLVNVRNSDLLPISHRNFLDKLKNEYNFIPKVCYDIGSAVLHWTRHAERVWPGCKIYLFDAFEPVETFYKDYEYSIGVLSDEDNRKVKFYQNDMFFGGNSYYKEMGFNNGLVFPEENYIMKNSNKLDTIVKERGFLLPDLIKIDVQGAEMDVLKGSIETLRHAKILLVELQHIHYNRDAPLANITIDYLKSIGWDCIHEKFSDNGPDADYCFINTKNF